jgi:hypothetical protein
LRNQSITGWAKVYSLLSAHPDRDFPEYHLA